MELLPELTKSLKENKMKSKELKELLSDIPDDFDVVVLMGHNEHEITDTLKADFGKQFALQIDTTPTN